VKTAFLAIQGKKAKRKGGKKEKTALKINLKNPTIRQKRN
jgi:hypothetical protein